MGRPINILLKHRQISLGSCGFTLIELLIVVIIIASAAAIISVAIGGDANEDEAYKEAEEFLLRGEYLAEQAIFRGETYGAFFYPDENKNGEAIWCYQWQRVRDARWQPLEELEARCLPPGFEVEILIDNQPWQYDDSLEYHDPIMGFYPSGEGSAMVNLRFFRESSSHYESAEEEFLLTPAGELHWVSEEERLKDQS